MFRIFNYNKKSNEKINYKFYKFLSIILCASFFLVIICSLFNPKISITLCFLWIILVVVFNLIISILLKKYFNCTVYILDRSSQTLYKMGIFPNVVQFKPSCEEFLTDNYFANYIGSDIKKYIKLRIIKVLNYSIKDFARDSVSLKRRDVNTTAYLNTLIKLSDEDYVLEKLNDRNFNGLVFKINKIYSYDFNEDGNYYIVCDVIENNKQIEYKNVTLTINNLFDENSEIKNYIINKCKKI